MYHIASVTAYDALDQVVVAGRIQTFREDFSGSLASEQSFRCQFDSTGEDDAKVWLRDALVALAETL